MSTALATKESSVPGPGHNVLRSHASRIHELMADWGKNTIALGKELKAAREEFKQDRLYPGWKQWLRREFKITEDHAAKLIRIAERFGHLRPSAALARTSGRVLYFLAQDATPPAAIREIRRKIARGQSIGYERARAIADSHRPKPRDANRMAAETGKPVAASDGNIYFGRTKDEAAAFEQQVEAVYSVRRAIETLATIQQTPTEFLKFMQPHQRWKANDEHQIRDASEWLHGFAEAWEAR